MESWRLEIGGQELRVDIKWKIVNGDAVIYDHWHQVPMTATTQRKRTVY